jgi:hypothetical protein
VLHLGIFGSAREGHVVTDSCQSISRRQTDLCLSVRISCFSGTPLHAQACLQRFSLFLKVSAAPRDSQHVPPPRNGPSLSRWGTLIIWRFHKTDRPHSAQPATCTNYDLLCAFPPLTFATTGTCIFLSDDSRRPSNTQHHSH